MFGKKKLTSTIVLLIVGGLLILCAYLYTPASEEVNEGIGYSENEG